MKIKTSLFYLSLLFTAALLGPVDAQTKCTVTASAPNYANNTAQNLSCDQDGNLRTLADIGVENPDEVTTQADNLANTLDGFVGTSFGYFFDGTAWDRVRGDSTNGMLVNLGGNNDVTIGAPVDVNIISGGGSGGTASDFGDPMPASGTAAGFSDGTNMVPMVLEADGSFPVTIVAGAGSGGTSATDDDVFTAGSGGGTPAMGFVTTDDVASGDVGVVGMTDDRALHVNLRSDDGTEKTTFAATQSGTWDEVGINDSGNTITVDGTVTVTDGAGAVNVIVDSITAGNNNIGDVDVASIAAGDNNVGNVDLASAIPAGTNNIGDVDVLTLPATPAGNNNIGDVDVASSALPTGASTAANQTTIIGHVDGLETLLGTSNTNTGAGTTALQILDNIVAGSEAQVDVVAALPAGTNNIGDVDILTIAAGDNNIGNMDVASSNYASTQAAALPAAATSVGYRSDQGLAAGTAGNTTPIICQDSVVISTATTANTQLVALTASETVYVCGYNFIASGTVDVQLIYGTGTACATGETDLTGAYSLTAQAGIVVQNPYPVTKGAVSNALCIELSGNVQVSGMLNYTKF